MKGYFTTPDLIEQELHNLGYYTREFYAGYPLLTNDKFRIRVMRQDDFDFIVEIGVEEFFDRWANSTNFTLRVSKSSETDIEKALNIAKVITDSGMYNFNSFFEAIPLEG